MQLRLTDLFSLFLLSVLISSCATYGNNYVPSEKDWATDNLLPDTLEVVHTVYLLGDAGESPEGGIAPAVRFFNKELAKADENSSAIILGDNIYFSGLPKKNAPDRAESEHDLAVQLDGLKSDNFKGKSVIIMGNHDWGQKDKIKGVERQDRFISKYMGIDSSIVYPKAGCGDPTTVELSDDLVVICIDSKWWIEDWDKLPDINDGCEVNSREAFMAYFEDQVTDHKGKNILVALHHPPHTNGPHGGQYTFLSHIFPAKRPTNNLWIPLPIIGTVVNATRSSVGTDTDKSHPRYKTLADGIISIAERHDSLIFVSGHDHTLQYFEIGSQRYIVSGSGAKSSATRAGDGAKFTTSGMGHVVLKVYEDGSVYTEFFVANADGETGDLVYRKKVKNGLPAIEEENEDIEIPSDTITYAPLKKTVRTSVYPDSLRLNLNKAVFGTFNSDLYFAEVDAPVLDLNEFGGGMEIIKPGGGKQTVSLRMKDQNGRVYNLRALRKDPSRSLPDKVNFPLSQRLMQFFFTGANPYGAFAVPPLAEAAGVYHTNPQLFYLPKQKALGRFNKKYGNQLYMLEERVDETWADTGIFGPGKKDVSYRKLFEEIRDEDDRFIKVNQPLALRNRLLDILIGDFDRHLDQFRFFETKTDDTQFYDPIPRDRDVAFSNWNGFAYQVGKLLDPFLRATHNFDDDIDRMKWLTYQARGFDNNFLNELTWEDWSKIAKDIQANMTDEVIEEAVNRLPKEIYAKEADKIRAGLRARRDDLMKYARKYYELTNKTVEILGSDNSDLFVVVRGEQGFTTVTGYKSNKRGEQKEQFYQRVFDPEITEEIRIFGLDNQDFFRVEGEAKKGIKVRLIGGYEEDTFTDNSKVGGFGKKTIVHDNLGPNIVEGNGETKDKRSSLTLQNSLIYFKDELYQNYVVPFAVAGFNPDDGVALGAKVDFHTFPYRKSNLQSFSASYFFATNAFSFGYRGDFESIFNNQWDLLLEAEVYGPQFQRNYFGFGNDTKRIIPSDFGENELDYHRTRMSKISVMPQLKNEFFAKNYFAFGLIAESIEIERTAGRFIGTGEVDVDPEVFDRNYFAGLGGELVFDFVDSALNPENGLKFRANANVRTDVSNTSRTYANLGTSLTFYNGWGEPRRLVLASKVGWSQNLGDYYFYQGVTLGGNDNLRGHRRDRFTGNSAFYQNTDLRLRLGTSQNNFIPFSYGILGGFDYGRVWEDDDDSELWHYGYGGGLWLSPVNAVILNLSYFRSREDERVTFMLGYLF